MTQRFDLPTYLLRFSLYFLEESILILGHVCRLLSEEAFNKSRDLTSQVDRSRLYYKLPYYSPHPIDLSSISISISDFSDCPIKKKV